MRAGTFIMALSSETVPSHGQAPSRRACGARALSRATRWAPAECPMRMKRLGDLEQDGVQPRPPDGYFDLAVVLGHDGDVFLVELEQPEKIHKVALDETQGSQVGQFGILELQATQRPDPVADFVGKRRQLHAGVAALEFVFDLRPRKLVQHDLHHGELVQVGVEQAGDDHGQGKPQKSRTRSQGLRPGNEATKCRPSGALAPRKASGVSQVSAAAQRLAWLSALWCASAYLCCVTRYQNHTSQFARGQPGTTRACSTVRSASGTGTGRRVSRSTYTWMKWPAAAVSGSPWANRPTSYLTLETPRRGPRMPASTVCGNASGAK